MQEGERGAAVAVQERVGGENLDVEADCGEYEVVEMDCVGLFLCSGCLVELTADLLEAARDASAGCGAFALDYGVLGGAQDDSVESFFLWFAEVPCVFGEGACEDDLV